MTIINLYPGSFGANCYLLEDSGHAWVVDPSASASAILRRVEADGCTLDGIVLTHGHFDHIMSVDTLREAMPGLKVCIHPADAPMLTDGEKNAFTFFFDRERAWHPADELLSDRQLLTVGNATLCVLHTPGHSPGSICLLCEDEHWMITGDTLFADSIGRCDLWQGDGEVLRRSIESLGALDGSLTIYPGHGDTERLDRALNRARRFFPAH